jgi:type II secretory pathway component PulJ
MTRKLPGGVVFGGGGRPHSFSLVEMLVAMAILSIIVVVLLSMTASMMTIWQFGQARNERRTTGQAVLERMSRDLRLASLPSSRSNTNSLEFVINPGGVSANYEFPQAVFWQAPVATDGGTNGNLAVVGYFVQWVTNGSSYTPCLSRVLINPSFANYYAIYSNPTSWISTSILTNNASATAASGYAGLLANNVLGLWVQALDPRGNPIQQSASVPGSVPGENFDSRFGYSYTNSVYTSVASTNLPSVLPSAVQIAIVIVDSRTAKRLTGTEKPTTLTGNFWSDIQTFYSSLPVVIKKGAEIQTTTVDLPNGPR